MHRPTFYTTFMIGAVRSLDIAIMNHVRWLARFNQAMVCGTAPEECITSENGHRTCAFGRWFYAPRSTDWDEWQEELEDIGQLHQSVHELARELHGCRTANAVVPPERYAGFVDLTIRLKVALRALQSKIVDNICLVDHLTGVWNRSSMNQKLREEHDRMVRNQQPCCLCMMDLDHFKLVNDTHGHIVGDKVLQAVTEVAQKRLRSYDSIFRYGGEEFLFWLPNIEVPAAVAAMDRIRADIERHAVTLADGRDVGITASFGVSSLSADLTLEENIELTDRALFCAKAQGRNQVCKWEV